MNSIKFVQIVRAALPGSVIEQLHLEQQVCRVRYGGQVFDISGGELDSWPLWMVTTPCCELNDSTGKVLAMLDSMSDEFMDEVRPWATTEELIRRLRELQQEDDDGTT